MSDVLIPIGGGLSKQIVDLSGGIGAEKVVAVTSTGADCDGTATLGAIATRTNPASSTTSGTLLASNAIRKSATIANDSTAILYVLYGNDAAASSTNYTYILPASSGIPSVLFIDDFSGIITGVWVSANGFARITEVS